MKKRISALILCICFAAAASGCGNVQQLAGWVQEETGGDLFPIQVTEPYSSD